MMKNDLLWQRWVALTIPLDITNSVINTWQLLCYFCEFVDVWVYVGAAMETANLVSECSSHCCHHSLPPCGDYARSAGESGRRRSGSTFPGSRSLSEAGWWEGCWSLVLWHPPLLPEESICNLGDWFLHPLVIHPLCSPFFSPGLYAFRPQPNNSVSGTGLSARAPTMHSLKQWYRPDQIMEGGTALLSQQHFSSKD